MKRPSFCSSIGNRFALKPCTVLMTSENGATDFRVLSFFYSRAGWLQTQEEERERKNEGLGARDQRRPARDDCYLLLGRDEDQTEQRRRCDHDRELGDPL